MITLAPELVAEFTAIVGPEHAIIDPERQQPYLHEWRETWKGRSALVLRPRTSDEVARVVALANAKRIAIVPQAGNTGLVGGQIPMHGEVVISVARLDRVRNVDAVGGHMTVEAGVSLADCQTAAERAGRFFPLSLPSEGTCRIGGNIATNAGGVAVLAYGNTRQQVLGLEVVLADGRVWNGLRALKKDNTGYDLRDLFIGSEGTLGIITAATLRLLPMPAGTATAIVACNTIDDVARVFATFERGAGGTLTAFEFMPRAIIECVLKNAPNTRDPFPATHAWYALVEITSADDAAAAESRMIALLSAASEASLITDARLATSLTQAKDLWRLRESVSEAQKPEGLSVKHDISVPIATIPAFVAKASALAQQLCPGARPWAFGHFGDGNVHYNVAQPVGMAPDAFRALMPKIMDATHDLVAEIAGSISAEHGIGQLKRTTLARMKSDVELDLMRAIKATLDPNGILNPGKLL